MAFRKMRNYAFEIFRIPYFAEACFWENSCFRKMRISVLENFSVPYFAEICFGRKMPFRKTRKGEFKDCLENEKNLIHYLKDIFLILVQLH